MNTANNGFEKNLFGVWFLRWNAWREIAICGSFGYGSYFPVSLAT
jgi:hypothetical protein